MEHAAAGFGRGGNESEEMVILDPSHVRTCPTLLTRYTCVTVIFIS